MVWRRWASIARLTIRKMCCLNGSRKLLTQKIFICPYNHLWPYGFSARSAIFCRYWTCTFSGSLRNAALSAFEEGAPFMGTALAEYRQCIGAEVVCHFHLLIYLFITPPRDAGCTNLPLLGVISYNRLTVNLSFPYDISLQILMKFT